MVKQEYLFVYGTLLSALNHPVHNAMIKYCQFYADAYLPGYLYAVDGYPGAIYIACATARIAGELYRIQRHSALFALLDQYEECSGRHLPPHEYIRRPCPIYAGEETISAWAYLYNRPVDRLPVITSGDFRQFIAKAKNL